MLKFRRHESEVNRRVKCPGHDSYGWIEDGQHSCLILEKYWPFAERIKALKVYEDDIWVVTYPKCGTTWAQEMVWLLNSQLDYGTAKEVNLNDRFPYLELSGVLDRMEGVDTVELVEKMKRPRHIKTHLPAWLMPDQIWTVKPKVIYVARNPKDVATSFYHHYRSIAGYRGTLHDFLDAYIADEIMYSPFHEHNLDFWRIRNENHILFLTFEEMKRNLPSVIKQTAEFLDKSYNEEEIDQLAHHLSFDEMKKNSACNNDALVKMASEMNNSPDDGYTFMRKGKVGAFKEELNEDDIRRLDDWTARKLSGTDFKFDF